MSDTENINPVEYLFEKGIDLKATALICYIEGCMRQPDLCELLEGYAKAKVEEYIYEKTQHFNAT